MKMITIETKLDKLTYEVINSIGKNLNCNPERRRR